MTKEEFKASLIDDADEIVYVVDMDSLSLLYLNKMALEMLGMSEDEALEQPCYKVLFGYDKPCENCSNEIVRREGHCNREHYNQKLNRYLYQKCRRMEIEGKSVKVSMTMDITDQKKATFELEKKLNTEATLVKCISTLYENDNMGNAINKLLSIVAQYYCADRAYIFEFSEDGKTLDNTYEWCDGGVLPQKEFLQNVDISAISRWIELFETKGDVFISAASQELNKSSLEYQLLEQQKIEALIAVPLKQNEKIIGFIGVDNPKNNIDVSVLMQSVAAFVLNEIEKRHNMELLYELSLCDRLTKVGNRHAYVKHMDELEGNTRMSLGMIFADINGLKKANDIYGHERGDDMIKTVANILKKHFVKNIYRIGGDEFVVFCEGIEENEFNQKVDCLKNSWCEDVTAAIGSLWLSKCENIEENVAKTDKLMYQDKKQYYVNQGAFIL